MERLLSGALSNAGDSRFSSRHGRHVDNGSFNWIASPEFASLMHATGTLSSTQSNSVQCIGTVATDDGSNKPISHHTETTATQTFDSTVEEDKLQKLIDTMRVTNQTLLAKVTQLQRELRIREEEAADLYRECKRNETANLIHKLNKATHRTQKASRLAKLLRKQR